MSVTVRAHPAMTVMQLKLHIKRSAAQLAASGDPTAATITVKHASALSLHADGVGALDDSATLGEVGIGIGIGAGGDDHPSSTHSLYVYFLAPQPAGERRPHTPTADMEFDGESLDDEEQRRWVNLTCIFANTPATPTDEADTEHHGEKLAHQTSTAAEADEHSSAASSRPVSRHGHNDSDDSPNAHGGRAGGDNSARPPASSGRTSRPSSSSRHGAVSGGPSTARTGAGDTSRKFLEDDGDIASQSSAGDEIRAREMALQYQQHALRMQQLEEQAAQQAQAQTAAAVTGQLQHSNSQAQIQLAASLAAAAGLVKGDLLDGYRLLRACGVDLPEEVSRATLSGCNPPLVDAVPEHLAEFTNLAYLDVSGNNLPMDRLRLLPLLDDLNLSCNRIRDVDFSPLLGTHYSPHDDPDAVRARVWPIEDMVGFPSLRKLDLSFNCLSNDAVHVLSVLPRLESLSLASNGLRHLPRESLANFWRLTKLSLRDNELGSGSRRGKERRVWKEQISASALSTTLARKGGVAVPPMPPQHQRRSQMHPRDAIPGGLLSDEEDSEDDESVAFGDDFASCPPKLRKEFRLLRALSTLPSLVELDLSENCLAAIPPGSIPPGPASFPKLQFLNLACNELRTEQSVLPLGDLLHLQWLDLRGNPFLSSSGASSSSSSSSARPSRSDRHAQLHGRRVNWATRFPDLYHVLVSNCRVNVVLARPRHDAQSMQQDLSHLLRPLGPAGAEQSFDGRLGDGIEAEAAAARSRTSSAKQRAFAQGTLHRPTGSNGGASVREEKEGGAAAAALPSPPQQQFGFSTAHEWESAEDAAQRPQDALQIFLAQQQQQLLAQQHSQSQRSLRAGADAAFSSTGAAATAAATDPFSEQYAAYSDTFLTGMNAEEIKHTPAFADSAGAAAGAAHSRAQPASSASAHSSSVAYPPAQLLARRATQHATHALGALLNHSGLSVLQASRPNKRLEAHKLSAPPTLLAKAGGASDPGRRRDFDTNKARVSMFGVRQPKVAKVYSRMEAVLASIENSFAPGASAGTGAGAGTGPGALSFAGAASSSMAPGLGSGRKPNVRGVASSAYVDPIHARTTDKLRALRHIDKERADVAQLLRTVSEVSKVALNVNASNPAMSS